MNGHCYGLLPDSCFVELRVLIKNTLIWILHFNDEKFLRSWESFNRVSKDGGPFGSRHNRIIGQNIDV